MQVQSFSWNIFALVAAGVVAVAGLWGLSQLGDEEPNGVQAGDRGDESGDEARSEERKFEQKYCLAGGPGRNVVEQGIDVAETIEHERWLETTPRPWPADRIRRHFEGVEPEEWGEFVDGVRTNFETDEKLVALTLDACDRGYDRELIDDLRRRQVPATLFVSGYWVDTYPETLRKLADDPLFEIANHGLHHLPCSVSGRDAAEIEGTESVGEAHREIAVNARKIEEVIGERPRYYRSGTAHYDEVCTGIAEKTAHQVVGFDVVGDLGAMYETDEIYEALKTVEPGSIVVLHMNKPQGDTAEGLQRALPELREAGYEFVRLSEVLDG